MGGILMSKVSVSKQHLKWLFGGMGFHNSEATMTALSQAYNMPMEKVRELCGEETLTSMKQDICRRKAIEFLVRHADITEVQI